MTASRFRRLLFGCAAALVLSAPALSSGKPAAKVEVTDGKVRPTPRDHVATLGTFTILASEDMRLVSVNTAAAKAVSFRRMTRDGSELRMDTVDSIALPAGVPVKLAVAPGQYHLMLERVVKALTVGSVMPMTAVVENVQTGRRQSIRFNAKVEAPRGRRAVDEDEGEH